MKQLSIAVCDDDNFFAQDLKTKIEKIILAQTDNICLQIDVFCSATELLANYNSNYSICFLDICLNKDDGIATGIKLKELYPDTFLVFVTSFIDFSLLGYKANAFRYLLKFSLDNLLPECINDILKILNTEPHTIYVDSINDSIAINVDNIMYIESFRHYKVIHLSNLQQVTCRATLSDFESNTKHLTFLKPHKSFIVNAKFIAYIKNYNIYLTDKSVIPISRTRYNEIKSVYLQSLGSNLNY